MKNNSGGGGGKIGDFFDTGLCSSDQRTEGNRKLHRQCCELTPMFKQLFPCSATVTT